MASHQGAPTDQSDDPTVATVLRDYLGQLRAKADLAPVDEPRCGDSINEFELRRLVGRGGMGTVWEARQHSLDRVVALKLLRGDVAHASRERFLREAQSLARVKHDNVVQIYAVGDSEGVLYIAQELVVGGLTVRDLVDVMRLQSLPSLQLYDEVASLAARVCDALQCVHDAGMIHRDIKPANILVSASGVPKVADFGIARLLTDATLSATGDMAGTVYYMSPEQASASAGEVDHRSDVFSMGATLYELLTTQRPFEGGSREEVLRKLMDGSVTSPDLVRPGVPRDLSAICMKALRRWPSDRYQSSGDFAADLRRFIERKPITARQVSAMDRLTKWTRRYPMAAALICVSLLGSVAVTGLYLQARTAREREGRKASELSTALQDVEAALHREQAAVADLAKANARYIEEKEAADDTTKFISSYLTSSGIGVTSGLTIPAVTYYQAAASGLLNGSFSSKPLARASIAGIVGKGLVDVGMAADGIAILEEARNIYRDRSDSASSLVLVLLNLAEAYQHAGNEKLGNDALDEAEQAVSRIVEDEADGQGRRRVVRLVKLARASSLCAQGRFSDAIAIAKAQLAESVAEDGNTAADTVACASVLARAMHSDGRDAEAVGVLHDYLLAPMAAIDTAELPELVRLSKAGRMLVECGAVGQGIDILRPALARQVALAGEDSPGTLYTAEALAAAYLENSLFDEAEAQLLWLERLVSKTAGPSSPDMTSLLWNRVLCQVGRIEQLRGNTNWRASAAGMMDLSLTGIPTASLDEALVSLKSMRADLSRMLEIVKNLQGGGVAGLEGQVAAYEGAVITLDETIGTR